VALVVEHRVDGEAVADPVPFGLAVDAENVFHVRYYEGADERDKVLEYGDTVP
jgi:hypothetical protein